MLHVLLNIVSVMITPQIQNQRFIVQKLRMLKEIELLMVLQQLEKASIVVLFLNWARTLDVMTMYTCPLIWVQFTIATPNFEPCQGCAVMCYDLSSFSLRQLS
jgi:hypothetical protein